jgi:hypothetical protein
VITCPIRGSSSCKLVSPSRHKGKAAKAAYAGKIHHYGKVLGLRKKSCRRYPAPIKDCSTRLIHPKCVDFLQGLADYSNETRKLGTENLMTLFV